MDSTVSVKFHEILNYLSVESLSWVKSRDDNNFVTIFFFFFVLLVFLTILLESEIEQRIESKEETDESFSIRLAITDIIRGRESIHPPPWRMSEREGKGRFPVHDSISQVKASAKWRGVNSGVSPLFIPSNASFGTHTALSSNSIHTGSVMLPVSMLLDRGGECSAKAFRVSTTTFDVRTGILIIKCVYKMETNKSTSESEEIGVLKFLQYLFITRSIDFVTFKSS